MSAEELTFASIGPWGIHYARCHPCECGGHFESPRWHTWADEDDIAHATMTGQPDPTAFRCGCYCADADPSTKDAPPDLPAQVEDEMADLLDRCDECDLPLSMRGDDLGCNCALCPSCGETYTPAVAGSGLDCDRCVGSLDDDGWDDTDPDDLPLVIDLAAESVPE